MTREEFRKATVPVKEDPHLIMEQMQTLAKAIDFLREEEMREPRVLMIFEDLRKFFLHDLLAHLREEEKEFVPAVANMPEGAGKADRLRRDHAELRQRIDEFKSVMTLMNYVGAETRLSLVWRLVIEARSILQRLKIHAAFECELVREMNLYAEPASLQT